MKSISRKLLSIILALFVACMFNISATPQDQEIGILKDVIPKEVKVVGDYYFIDDNPDPQPIENPSSHELDGIPVTYLIR